MGTSRKVVMAAKKEPSERLAQKLRVLRAREGLSLEEAAQGAGITRQTLGPLERGKRHAYRTTLEKLARGYGVPVEELLEPQRADEEAALTFGESLRRRYGLEPDHLADLPRLSETAESLGIGEEYKEVYMDLLRAEQEPEDKHGERMIGPTYAVEFVCHLGDRVVELLDLIERLPPAFAGEASERQDLDSRALKIRERVRKLLELEIEEVRALASRVAEERDRLEERRLVLVGAAS